MTASITLTINEIINRCTFPLEAKNKKSFGMVNCIQPFNIHTHNQTACDIHNCELFYSSRHFGYVWLNIVNKQQQKSYEQLQLKPQSKKNKSKLILFFCLAQLHNLQATSIVWQWTRHVLCSDNRWNKRRTPNSIYCTKESGHCLQSYLQEQRDICQNSNTTATAKLNCAEISNKMFHRFFSKILIGNNHN